MASSSLKWRGGIHPLWGAAGLERSQRRLLRPFKGRAPPTFLRSPNLCRRNLPTSGQTTRPARTTQGHGAMTPKRPPSLDRIDIKILAILQRDGRSTIQKLAETVGLSPRPCLERVRRLETAGIIVGYQAVVALERLSRPLT